MCVCVCGWGWWWVVKTWRRIHSTHNQLLAPTTSVLHSKVGALAGAASSGEATAAGAGATGAGLVDTTAGVESGEGPEGLYELAVVVRLGLCGWAGGWV